MIDVITLPELTTAFETTTVTRTYAAPPARVFAALTDRAAMPVWASPGPDFAVTVDPFDFREGGRCRLHMANGTDAPWINDELYQQILPDRRIITTSGLRHGGKLLFAGTLVYDLVPEAGGTKLTVTEHGVFPDGHDTAEMHRMGWAQALDQLDAWLAGR